MYLQFGKTTHASGFTARLNDFADRLARRITLIAKALEGHQAARRMAALDDRILDDIGLSRADVDRAVLSPLLSDPRQDLETARKQRIAGRNRSVRRRR